MSLREFHPALDDVAEIRPEERDQYLRLGDDEWGPELGRGRWQPKRKPSLHYRRAFPVHRVDGGEGASAKQQKFTQLEEWIIPFPSPPIVGINRKMVYGKAFEHRPNMHSLRLLRRPATAPITRLFVLHNGLNESEDLKFFYRLADWIMRQQKTIDSGEGVACLVVPFPGHLTHAPFHGPFSETPLSRYLSDAGDLFRQFLKYMVGMRWLLGWAADSDAEDWMVGGDLLTWDDKVSEVASESRRLHKMSAKRVARTEEMGRHAGDEGSPPSDRDSEDGDVGEGNRPEAGPEPQFDIGEETPGPRIAAAAALLRDGLQRDSEKTPESLRVHVVGYSLGGFVAQSVFFAWPQVVSSCTTICSGGAISSLSPTAFAQPEEWQSVLHALRPEMTNSMLQGRLGDDERDERNFPIPVDMVAGIPLRQYGYFQRIFEQVFLQEDRASYKERLSEYGLRMLFVSGGEDPIVPPANILDASPREGTTMLSIAGMTHFLNQDPRDEGDRREKEQRDFWLPEAGGLIARAAIHAEQVHAEERKVAAELKRGRTRPSQRRAEPSGLLTDGYLFEEALDWVLEAVDDSDGWLLVCRNVLPAAFIPTDDFTRWGTGLHHHDLRIQRYTLGLRHRRGMLRRIKDRTTLIVPEQLEPWFVDLSAQFDPHSDAPGGRLTTRGRRRRIWDKFEEEWAPCLRHFDSGKIGDPLEPGKIDSDRLTDAISSWIDAKHKYLEATHLPDVWIGIDPESTLLPDLEGERSAVHQKVIEKTAKVLEDQKGDAKEKVKGSGTKLLRKDLADGHIRVVQISAAEFNPRYQGKVERSPSAVAKLLARSAAALVRSRQVPELIR
jgi:pimeloyl-ACP methyl ester carboxylesterase